MAMTPAGRALAATLAGACVFVCCCVPAWAQESQGTLDRTLEDLHLKARVAPAPDFVRASRPAHPGNFIPVGRQPAEPQLKVMTPEEVAATTATLDAERERQQRRAGRKPTPVPLKPAPTTAAKNTVR